MNGLHIQILDQQHSLAISAERLKQIAAIVLQAEGIAAAEINVLLVDNPTIHALNVAHLGHDFPTDVITFPLNDPGQEPPEFPLEGEIVISTEMACEAAEFPLWDAERETQLYLIHALLHLCGYDDLEESLQIQMRQRERELLLLCNIPPDPHDPRWQGCE